MIATGLFSEMRTGRNYAAGMYSVYYGVRFAFSRRQHDAYLRVQFRYELFVRGYKGVAQRAFRIRRIMHALDQVLMQVRRTIRCCILPTVAVEHGVIIRHCVILQRVEFGISTYTGGSDIIR